MEPPVKPPAEILNEACREGNLQLVKALLGNRSYTEKHICLDIAIEQKHSEIVDYLISSDHDCTFVGIDHKRLAGLNLSKHTYHMIFNHCFANNLINTMNWMRDNIKLPTFQVSLDGYIYLRWDFGFSCIFSKYKDLGIIEISIQKEHSSFGDQLLVNPEGIEKAIEYAMKNVYNIDKYN